MDPADLNTLVSWVAEMPSERGDSLTAEENPTATSSGESRPHLMLGEVLAMIPPSARAIRSVARPHRAATSDFRLHEGLATFAAERTEAVYSQIVASNQLAVEPLLVEELQRLFAFQRIVAMGQPVPPTAPFETALPPAPAPSRCHTPPQSSRWGTPPIAADLLRGTAYHGVDGDDDPPGPDRVPSIHFLFQDLAHVVLNFLMFADNGEDCDWCVCDPTNLDPIRPFSRDFLFRASLENTHDPTASRMCYVCGKTRMEIIQHSHHGPWEAAILRWPGRFDSGGAPLHPYVVACDFCFSLAAFACVECPLLACRECRIRLDTHCLGDVDRLILDLEERDLRRDVLAISRLPTDFWSDELTGGTTQEQVSTSGAHQEGDS